MLIYKQNDLTENDLFLTLNEKQTLSEPFYLFEFTHQITKAKVQFTKTTSDDKSMWPERYNLFSIKPGELFVLPGEWHFTVIEQQTGEILEQGIMLIEKENKFNYTSYNAATSFTTYRG